MSIRRVDNPPNPWTGNVEVDYDLGEAPRAELEVYEEEARSIVARNNSPDIPQRFTLNPYRGCYHACAFCLSGETLILMADGRSRPLAELRVGDRVYGTTVDGRYRRYVPTEVLAHWQTHKPAFEITLEDGRKLVASGDHRFLTQRGWKYVRAAMPGAEQRAYLTDDQLLGPTKTQLRNLIGQRVESSPKAQIGSIEALYGDRSLFDITTGTGDFIAEGVISHNCYARPFHQYLGFGAGSDFERRIVVKVNAPQRLRATFEKPSWTGETILFSGVTDCYQPLEASYRLTRRCLEVCRDYRQPVAIITRSALIRRDVDVLAELARRAHLRVFLSIGYADDAIGRALEPHASAISQRFVTLRRLSEAGVSCGVAVAPIIPGLSDSAIPEILTRAAEAGASRAFITLLRLPDGTRPVFEKAIAEAFPERAGKVLRGLESMRGGQRDERRFGERMRGHGPRWRAIVQLFQVHCRRLGLSFEERNEVDGFDPPPTTFRRPGTQGTLFD